LPETFKDAEKRVARQPRRYVFTAECQTCILAHYGRSERAREQNVWRREVGLRETSLPITSRHVGASLGRRSRFLFQDAVLLAAAADVEEVDNTAAYQDTIIVTITDIFKVA